MDTSSLTRRSGDLLAHMEREGYSRSYVDATATEIRWIERNGGRYVSYEEACAARESETRCPGVKMERRVKFGIIKRFDVDGEPPRYRSRQPLLAHNSYSRLVPEFREVVDRFRAAAPALGYSESTVASYVSCASSFLLSAQERGHASLSEVTEADVLAHFSGGEGGPRLTRMPRGAVAAVLGVGRGDGGEEARILSLLPMARSVRRNVDYLRPEELSAIGAALSGDELSLLDRAIGSVLLHTGMRASDVAGLTLDCIDWDLEEISIVQAKTGVPLTIPLVPRVGNAIYDYVEGARPDTGDRHLFLSPLRPHAPMSSYSVRHAARRVYEAAGVRLGAGERRGTHLFRHNAATTMVAGGVSRPVASAVLGQADPTSIDAYLHAGIAGLRRCALDVSAFPVAKGVFD